MGPLDFAVAGHAHGLAVASQPGLYLALAVVLLVVALRFLKRAVEIIGVLTEVLAAATIAAIAVSVALALLAGAALGR
jgi:hypothetical protein